ncbi:hypothetical protein MHU86_14539 [Fragilaria crotonensis]|nr:hypothetical protein MHU86_14539 [Fragilaria crotonensis]
MNSQANNAQSKGRTTRNFHAVMDVILNGMSKAQAGNDCRLRNVPLKLGGQWVVVDIVCPLLFVINDEEFREKRSLNTSRPLATKEVGRGTRYHIRCFRDPNQNNRLVREVVFITETREPIHLEPNLALFIVQSYSETDLDENGEGTIECSTEYTKYEVDSEEKCISIRAHPNFRGDGYPWYDWALIRFEDNQGNLDDFPCRIVSCIHRRGHPQEDKSFDLVVQSCNQPTGRESILFTEWTFDRKFYVVSSTALVSLCYVLVDGCELTDTVFVVKDKESGHLCFTNLCGDPHSSTIVCIN